LPEELLDIVDDHDRIIGRAPRHHVHAHGLKHRAVHIFVFNPAGELLVQKRSRSKDTFPGCYDSSASGHLNAGEDYDACALRELREELGLNPAPAQLRKHFKIPACPQTGWEFVWTYSIQTDAAVAPNPQEILWAEFWPVERVRALILQQPEKCAPGFVCVFEQFAQRGLIASAGR
jgi:isopentenyl-diphosphate delta-isomerase type 1